MKYIIQLLHMEFVCSTINERNRQRDRAVDMNASLLAAQRREEKDDPFTRRHTAPTRVSEALPTQRATFNYLCHADCNKA